MRKLIAIAAALAATTTLTFTAEAAKKPAPLTCPVMKSKIASKEKASGKSVYKGKTYYFCCSGCKPLFDKNPAKYAGK